MRESHVSRMGHLHASKFCAICPSCSMVKVFRDLRNILLLYALKSSNGALLTRTVFRGILCDNYKGTRSGNYYESFRHLYDPQRSCGLGARCSQQSVRLMLVCRDKSTPTITKMGFIHAGCLPTYYYLLPSHPKRTAAFSTSALGIAEFRFQGVAGSSGLGFGMRLLESV